MRNLTCHGTYNHYLIYMHEIVYLYRYSFTPLINSEKTGYYKLIVGEPVFENPCSYDAVEKVMYFMIHVLVHAHCMTHTMYAKQ